MKINTLLLLILLLFLFNCKKPESQKVNDELMIEAYDYRYMDYDGSILVNYIDSDNLIWLEYNTSNKLAKRIGGVRQLSATSGYDYQITNEVFDEITYTNNEIKVDRINNHDNNTAQYTREFILENDRISRMIVTDVAAQTKDTVDYSYDSLGRLSQRIDLKYYNTYPSSEITSNFYFNQNLDSIITTYVSPWDGSVEKIVKDIFSNYDTTANPLKNLIIFDETFNRSLSENNYAKHEEYTYTPDNELTWTHIRTWGFYYDEDGNISYGN